MVILVVFNSLNVVQNLKKPNPVARQMPPFNSTNINSEKNKKTDITLLDREITELEKIFRDQRGSGVFTSKNEFVKLLILLTQLLTKTSSKEFKNDTSKLSKNLCNTKQITKRVLIF